LGSAQLARLRAGVSRTRDGVLAIAEFRWLSRHMGALNRKQSSFRRDAATNTRDVCAPQKSGSLFLVFQITQREIGSAWKSSRF